MASAPTEKRVFISAAEHSADLHAAELIRATHAADPEVRFIGIAGPRMRAAGCECLFDMTRHSAMLLGAIGAAGNAMKMLAIAERTLRMHPFSAVVVLDSPTLHLPLAGRAHAAGLPVLYYIAPQLWAWGANRIYKMRHRVTKTAVILPFEEKFFRDQGVDATWVGHPLADKFRDLQIDEQAADRLRDARRPLVALLPGSRKHVVEALVGDQLAIAARLRQRDINARFAVSVASPEVAPIIDAAVGRSAIEIEKVPGDHAALLSAADLAIVASGTTTLEVAFHNVPMVVMYQASKLFYNAIGRWIIKTPHLSLPNILAQSRIVPEFMPYYESIDPIVESAAALLREEDRREKMRHELERVVAPLREKPASANAARMLLDIIAGH